MFFKRSILLDKTIIKELLYYDNQRTYFPFESLNFLQIILQSWMSCRTCSNSASCCLFSFWKNVNLFLILFVVSSLIQFLNASSLSFSFSINMSCCFCASRNLLSKPRILSRHSVPSSPLFVTFCQLCTSARTCTYKNHKILQLENMRRQTLLLWTSSLSGWG